jgi:hypothetical protein
VVGISTLNAGSISGRVSLAGSVHAEADRTHLTLLAKAARLYRDPQLLHGLRAAQTGHEVVRLMRAADRNAFRANPEVER